MTHALPEQAPAAPERARVWPEYAFPAGLLALGVFTLVDAATIAVPVSTNTVGPRVFPYAVGALLVLAAVLVGLGVRRGERAEIEDGEDVDTTAATDWPTVAKVAAAFIALVVLVEPAGFPIAATVLFGAVAWSLGARPLLRPVLVGALIAVTLHVLFTQVLGVFLPAGPLEGVPGFG
ncbi:tripartite tricarboxylate transporter TctB family protein [Modestobacter sp. Leaf380]|uniref:tripartite tricarboxylate transporter TctB family protein n=1 Tax=Modestobacter sp. Leaf380 TaxID=1736356 RepID=UPI0006FEBA86|nr:tripartite tricarboxylate transporter TctB family protein [Modestobacter sp. Leaf380]KQS72134.1 hypothetical protein ASG41_18920 [Modestobacter sp. Leaf380]